MIKLGIIGFTPGNGHPYSYSAIFNGFNKRYLDKYCEFKLIKEYLPKYCQKKNQIKKAQVTHIWTQDLNISKKIAKSSKIPFIVKNFEDLIGKVDGVIIARDDVDKHLFFAKPFLKKKIPVFIDKLLVSDFKQFNEFKKLAKSSLFMSGSAMRYNYQILKFNKKFLKGIKSIHGKSHSNIETYGYHLIEPIIILFGKRIKFVKYIDSNKDRDLIQIFYQNGLNVILEFTNKLKLPIKLSMFSEKYDDKEIYFNDFYNSFKLMLEKFVLAIKQKRQILPRNDIYFINKLIISLINSKKKKFQKNFY